jgi:hypothetical protein
MKKNSPRALLLNCCLALASGSALAAEGMWTLDNLPADKIAKEYGFRPSAEWGERVMHSSARLAGGCSGSYISASGLVLTNHHCARSCVEDLSTADKDYNKLGFLARTRKEEPACPGVELNRLDKISDVTTEVKSALAGLSGEDYVHAERAVTAKLTSACAAGDPQRTRCDVVNLYHGGRYNLYRYHRFQDVRLVFVPEEDVAFFGGDPDNFNFPRYDLDMALVRAYEDGKPAVVKDYFPVNPAGAQAGELVFVTGHPGHTDRQLTRDQLELQRDIGETQRLIRLAEMRGLLTQYGKSSPEAARISTNDLFGVENSFKALTGQLQTLQDPAFWRAKNAEEKQLQAWFKTHPDKLGGDPWQAIATADDEFRGIATEFRILEGAGGFWSQHFSLARTLVRGASQRAKPNTERFSEFSDSALPRQEQLLFSPAPIYPDYERVKLGWSLGKLRELLGADDPRVKKILGRESPQQVADRVVAGTHLSDIEVRRKLWSGGQAAIDASDDPMILLAKEVEPDALALRKRYENDVESVIRKNTERIAATRFAMSGTGVYPDATFTLRLSYGDVRGWQEHGHAIPPFTNYAGAFERATGVDPFVLPPSWLAAKPTLRMDQRMNFVTTNDIIGGNSGSPIINQKREIVGLIFDGNLPSLGGDFWYDISVNRAVAVHAGAIVDALENIYGAGDLANEMLGR